MSLGPSYERDAVFVDNVQPLAQPAVGGAAPVAMAAEPVGGTVRRASVWRFDPASAITVLFGIALLILGLIALIRAGTDGDWSTPTVSVAGFDHTAILAVIEIGAGLLLMIAGFSTSRGASMFFATLLGIAAVVAAVQADSLDDLAIESAFAWLIVVGSVLVVLADVALPTVVDRRATVSAS